LAKAWGVHRLWRRSGPASPTEAQDDVLGECTQFLEGQLLESFRDNLESAPDWVWVSVLAHASKELLVSCAAEGGTPGGSSNRCVWDRTLSFLSQVLLDHAERTGEPVSLLQHDVVVPIELQLGARPLAPPTLVRLVLTGLQEREVPSADHPAPTTEKRA
jgi:hypothetical protein